MTPRRDERLSLEQSKRLSKARVLGVATALPILLEDWELAKISAVILSDTKTVSVAKELEPILASALGGQPYGARNSPIKRVLDQTKGRQVDCIVGKDAYEFKLRVTIAASGQGRFAEELDFAKDCRKSGFSPILLVLDPTPSTRLDDLRAEYKRFGGRAFVGNEAWQHLEREAGPTMATLIEKYVRLPISMLDEHAMELLDLYVSAERDRSALHFRMSKGKSVHEWTVRRAENPALATEADEPEE